MRPLLVALIIGLSAGFITLSVASNNEVKTLTTVLDCAASKDINEFLLTKYGEKPVVQAEGKIDALIKKDKIVEAVNQTVIYFNKDTATFTVVAVFLEDKMSCILTSGFDFKPYTPPGLVL